MILGISGLKNAGKDTVGQYLVDNYGYERRAFADKLKEATCALFDINRENIEYFKNDSTRVVGVFRHSGFNMGGFGRVTEPITFRHFLQRMGTEVGRNIFGEDFWVDQCLPVTVTMFHKEIVVTDVRFPNEVQRIRNLGGKIIRVERPGLQQDAHVSEQLPECDILITNDGTLDELYTTVTYIMNKLLSGRD